MATKQLIVLSNPTVGREDEFNSWYEGQHLPDVLAVPGFLSAQRFKVAAPGPQMGTPSWGYLVIYEIDADQFEAAWAELGKRSASQVVRPSDSIDLSTMSVMLATPLGGRVTS